jgi:NAD(P) transhydrogenase subunit alpha
LSAALAICAALGAWVQEPGSKARVPEAPSGRIAPLNSETGGPVVKAPADAAPAPAGHTSAAAAAHPSSDTWSLFFVFALSTFIGLGVILRVSRLLHTPLMSITNAISAIAVVGAIIVAGSDYPLPIRILGAIALFASMTNIVSGFLITDRMLKMFKQTPHGGAGR